MSQLHLVIQYLSHLMIFKENYDYRGYRDAEPYDSEVSYQKCQPTDKWRFFFQLLLQVNQNQNLKESPTGGGERPKRLWNFKSF